jgi:type IX secretion system substrate protein
MMNPSRIAPASLFLVIALCTSALSQSSNSPGPPVISFGYVDYITTSSAMLGVVVVPRSNNASAWFEWGTTLDYGDSTPPSPITFANSDPYATYAVTAQLTGLPIKTIFHFRGVAQNDSGRVYGEDISFITMPPEVVTLTPDSITKTTARLNGTCNPSQLRTGLYFVVEIPYGVPYLATPVQYLEVESTATQITATVTGLTPGATYYSRLCAYNSDFPVVSAKGGRESFATLVDTSAMGLIIPLTVAGSSRDSNRIYFGVHTYATPCLDPPLGEAQLPPLPPGGFDLRFLGRCIQLGSYSDFRPIISPTQADTYSVRFQADDGEFPVRVYWPDLNQSYSGSVEMTTLDGVIDMKGTTSLTITDPSVQNLRIVAQGPLPKQNSPNVITFKSTSTSATDVHLQARIYPNGRSTSAWFEWGTDTNYANHTSHQDAGSSAGMVLLETDLEGLAAGTVYHYRAVAENSMETAYGLDQTITTGAATGVHNAMALPDHFALHQNYPNPFNPLTKIEYDLPVGSHVELRIYDLLGEEVRLIVDEIQEAGFRSVSFDAGRLPSGVYFYTLRAGGFTNTRKMLLVR